MDDSFVELTKMSIESELTIEEHCISLRQQLDIARETALENIHKASITLITEIDAYELECLSGWRAVKESTEHAVEDVSKRMRALLAEQHAFLQSVQERDDELTLRLDEANKLAQELSDRKKEFKTAMFGNKLASFTAYPSDVSLGELTFTHITVPFKKLYFPTKELKQVNMCANFDFLLPLNDGQRIITFKVNKYGSSRYSTISCFERLGRQIGEVTLQNEVKKDIVAQCGPGEFIVCHSTEQERVIRLFMEYKLSVYDSDMKLLRNARCKTFSNICCNSKFVFGLWDDDYEREEEYSSKRIQVCHLDTLNEAFCLCVTKKYDIVRIMADEHHVVAISHPLHEWHNWFMTIFDLATCNENGGDNKAARYGKTGCKLFMSERNILLSEVLYFTHSVLLLDGWLGFPHENKKELVWFDKKGNRSETSTELDTRKVGAIYSWGSSLLFTQSCSKLVLKW